MDSSDVGNDNIQILSNDSDLNFNAHDSSSPHNSNCLLDHVKLPAYLAEAFQDLYEEDGLLVAARGLGILHLIASFCRFYADLDDGHYACIREELSRQQQQQRQQQRKTKEDSIKQDDSYGRLLSSLTQRLPLVFVIGLKDYERSCLISILERWGTPPHLLPMEITNEIGQGKDRSQFYGRGGIFLITSRILIVDLLNHVASPADIDGILVAHAETVSETSTEAFILRIFRTQKRLADATRITFPSSINSDESSVLQSLRYGFIKAFTDNPDSLMSGFANVDKVLKSLFVRRLYLYPRFRTCVIDELEKHPPIVEEMHQQLSPNMQVMQAAIATAVKSCIREIKRSTNLIDWSDAQLTLENCVTTNFDLTISRQLEHDWHRLKPATKQLVHDLKQLRTLFHYLLQYDCIAFYRLIQNIKSIGSSSRFPSLWLLTPAADTLFSLAKERIYRIVVPKASTKNPDPMPQIQPILEENPKWKLLHQVLSEIQEKSADDDVRILIMVKDEKTLDTLKSYLVDGPQKCMNLRWLRYLKAINDRSRSSAKASGGSSYLSEEIRLLLEEEGRVRNLLFGTESKACTNSATTSKHEQKRKTDPSIKDVKRKRRKIHEEKSRGSNQTIDEKEQAVALSEAVKEVENFWDDVIQINHGIEHGCGNLNDNVLDEDNMFSAIPIGKHRVVLQTYSSVEGEESYMVLHDLRPTHVVLYDAEPSFIRSLELYSSCSEEEERLRVYFMLFESSSEEKNYLKALEREQQAFERLIHYKKTMSVPINMIGPWTTQEMQLAGGSAVSSYGGGLHPLSADTRSNKKRDDEKRDIAVDVREFRSALPSILHQGGMRLAPVTLTVGDFVLSNVHCVERKSISDLFGSFASGRLHTQAEAMSKYYKVPCLLIEFDPMKTFALQNVNEIGPDIRMDSICSKISLLVMHFPMLRLLWSKSPHETLKIFKSLKANHEEVDVNNAVAVGSNESLDSALMINTDISREENEINEAARDMLLSLPGITVHNARKVMTSCDSISELAKMSRGDLKNILGALTGQKLFTFFNQKG